MVVFDQNICSQSLVHLKIKGDKSRILQRQVPSNSPCVATKCRSMELWKCMTYLNFFLLFFSNFFGNWECIVSGYDLLFFTGI